MISAASPPSENRAKPRQRKPLFVAIIVVLLAALTALFAVSILDVRRAARVDSLIAALADDSTAPAAREALSRCRSRYEIERLMEAFLDKNERIRSQIPSIVADIGPSAAPVIADAMMREMRPPAVSVWEYYAWFTNESRGSGWYSNGLVTSARSLEDPVAEYLIAESLSSAVVRRAAAAGALAWLGGDKALFAAESFVSDDSLRVRRQLAIGLSHNGRAEALAPLMRISFEPEPHEGHETTAHAHPEVADLVLTVTGALRRIAADTGNAPACLALLKDPFLPPPFRVHIITGFGDANDPALVDEIAAFLSHDDALARAAAARALPPDERTNRALAAVLADDDPAVVASARDYFAIKAHSGMVEALLAAHSAASSPSHRAELVKALMNVRDGRHNDYPAPPAELVAQLRRDARAALDKIHAAQNVRSAEPAASQPLPLDSTSTL